MQKRGRAALIRAERPHFVSLRVGAAGGPGAVGGVAGMAAQVVDPGAIAVARRQVHPVGGGADRFQVVVVLRNFTLIKGTIFRFADRRAP